MALQSDHEFAPTEIARVVFPTAFRGYDQDAVRRYLSRLAAALEHQQTFDDLGDLQARTSAHDRVEELEAEVVTLQEEIRELETELVQRSVDEADQGSRRGVDTVEFDETRAIELLGQETARVLESARSAAADILKRAENQAASLKSEAKKELAEARREAKRLVADRRAEAEAAIDELTAEAERSANRVAAEAEEHRLAVVEESSRLLAEAETQAEAEQTGAQERARQIVSDAEALRHQVVAELVSDRRAAQADVDRLVESRDRLAMALALARSELDHLAEELAEPASPRNGEGSSAVEVDGDEVARLIERLDAEADAGPGAGQTAEAKAGEERSGSEASGSGLGSRSSTSQRSGSGSGRSRAGRSTADRRRSTIDEPTEEMPAIELPSGAAADADPADGVAGEAEAGDVAADEAPVEDAGVFGIDEPSPATGRDGRGDADDGGELDDDLIDLRDVDVDVDEIPDSDDVLNAPPTDGAPLSLVEGFSTIVLGDEDEATNGRGPASANGRNGAGPGHEAERVEPSTAVGVLVEEPSDPALIITTVSARLDGRGVNRTQGDLPVDEPYIDRLPAAFGARDVALTRSGANLRRQLRRALNDDQSEVLDRLRSGRGAIAVDELLGADDQIEHYRGPLRRGLTDIAVAGARAGGGSDVAEPSLDNLVEQLAAYIVQRVRTPTVVAIEEADHEDRERILEPVRSGYRDFRNIGLPDLLDDALHEAFAIGLYDAIEDDALVAWVVDPRTDPDPVNEVNRDRTGLRKGEPFPSGHVRPLSVPGCRCLLLPVE